MIQIKIPPVIIFCTVLSSLYLHAQDLLNLPSFKEKTGWNMVKSGEVNPTKSTEFTLTDGDGKILSNGQRKSKAAYLTTSKKWSDHEINAEFMITKGSNSGFYVLGRYEIQVLDSHGKEEITISDMGSLYQRWDKARQKQELNPGFEGVAPLVNAALPYGEWQTINIKFRAPRFDEKGEKISHAHFVEVTINGKVVQKNVNAKGPTRAAPLSGEEASGPLAIQGNHGPILLRKLDITSRDYSDIELPKLSPAAKGSKAPKSKSRKGKGKRKSAKQPQEDLEKLGKEALQKLR